MWGGKSLWVKVVTILPQAMNANITELMEFHSPAIYYWKVWEF